VPPLGNPTTPGYLKNSIVALAGAPDELHPSNENDYYRRASDGLINGIPAGREAAAALGKSLFWDMQVGSDGVQSCGSCHFHAGVDNRTEPDQRTTWAAPAFQLHPTGELSVRLPLPGWQPGIVAESPPRRSSRPSSSMARPRSSRTERTS
jgi:hypothetical protein